MKFELPPPLPEKGARRLQQTPQARSVELAKRPSQSIDGAERSGPDNVATIPQVPPLQPSEGRSTNATEISPEKSRLLSTMQSIGSAAWSMGSVGVGLASVSVIVVFFIILGSWNRSAKSPAGDSKVALLDNTKHSTAAPSPAYVADSTPSATPTVSLMRVSPPANATPSDADLKAKIVGYWSSGRHVYEYRADGSWCMCPVSPHSTHGHWKVLSGVLYDGAEGSALNPLGKIVSVDNQKLVTELETLYRSENGNDWSFPRNNPQAYYSHELSNADDALNEAWHALPSRTHAALLADQRSWIKRKDSVTNLEQKVKMIWERVKYLESLR